MSLVRHLPLVCSTGTYAMVDADIAAAENILFSSNLLLGQVTVTFREPLDPMFIGRWC